MRIEGVYVALLTPLDAGGAVEAAGVAGHVERLLAAGIDGVVACGTTGEFADLLPGERAAVIAAVVDAVAGRVPVLAGVGAVGTSESCAHARAAADVGADGLLALPPLYWKLGDEALVRHFAEVAGATALPVLAYDFPSLTGTALASSLVERLAREVGVAGIKLSGPQLRTVHGVIDRVRPHTREFAVMVGAAELALPALLAGADGVIAAVANITPEPLVSLLMAVRAGDHEAAVRHHARVLALLALTGSSTPPILALKAAAAACGSALHPVVRTPPDAGEDVVRRASEMTRRLLADQPAGGAGSPRISRR